MNQSELLLPSLLFVSYCFWIFQVTQVPLAPGPKRPTQNLSDWLDLATWKLVPSAKTRIRSEIEAHYAESFQLHRAQGASASDAHAAALAALGNAQTAGRRFRREHLQEKDVIQINWCKKYPYGLLILAFGCLFPLLVTGAPTVAGGIVIGALEFVLIATSCSAFLLAQQENSPALLCRLTLLYALYTLTLGSLFILFSSFVDSPAGDGLFYYLLTLAALCALITHQSLSFFRMSQKLRSTSEDDFPGFHPDAA